MLKHDATTVGMLLGLAVSRIGETDESTVKSFCLHLPFLLPPSYDLYIDINV